VPQPLLHPHRGRTDGSRRAATAAVADIGGVSGQGTSFFLAEPGWEGFWVLGGGFGFWVGGKELGVLG
jgi:hypothetical protein